MISRPVRMLHRLKKETVKLFASLLLVIHFVEPAEGLAQDVKQKYFRQTPFEVAQRMLVTGNPKGAIKRLKTALASGENLQAAEQANYLLGLALLQNGDYEEASEVFGTLLKTYPILRDDHLYYRALSLYRWGSKLEAAKIFAQVDPLGPRGGVSTIFRGRALYESTAFAELRPWLEEHLRNGNLASRELKYYLAESRYRTGDPYGALALYRELWRDRPRGSLAVRALERIPQLRLDGKLLLSKSEIQIVEQLKRIVETDRRLERALKGVEENSSKRKLQGSMTAEIAYARGRLAEMKGAYRNAIGHYMRSQTAAPVTATKVRALAGLAQGRCHKLLGQVSSAARLFATVADRFPELPESEEALFLAGEVLLANRKHEEAEERYRDLLLKNPATVFRAQCLWGLAWVRFRQGKYDEARPFFSSLTKLALPEEMHAASLYWLGRTEASLGMIDDAKVHFSKLVTERPLSFYASLASDLLIQVEPSRPLRTVSSTVAESLGTKEDKVPQELVRVKEFIRLGLRARARKALSLFEQKARSKRKRLSASTLETMAKSYEALNLKLQARYVREEFAREYPSTLGQVVVATAARQAHPLKFEAEIRKAAKEFGVRPSLLFALVRTESNFRSVAVSSQNAYGLAQLILPTAKSVARKLGIKRVSPQRLVRDPLLNVRLGASYLKSLLNLYGGSEVLALAAYNAGPGAVSSWMMNRVRKVAGQKRRRVGVGLTPSPDEMVEEIPVKETKTYVRKVLGRQRVYERLYGTPQPALPALKPLELAPSVIFEPTSSEIRVRTPDYPLIGARVFHR